MIAEEQVAAPYQRTGSGPLELCIVVPTFKERANVAEVVRRVGDRLTDIQWEIIFVDDDSPDGTADLVREVAQQNPRVRCLQRIGRRGLASACLEGMLASSAPILAVMDADLQHDEQLLRPMLVEIKRGELDIVVGSRYAEGGGLGEWDGGRASISRIATKLSKMVLKVDLKDPMSGFFMITREALFRCVRAGMSSIGFKILLDLFAASPQPLRFRELPYQFRARLAGESKLDSMVAWEYGLMLLDRVFGRVVPVRFIAFALVGSFGILVHLAVLATAYRYANVSFVSSQALATLVAMTSNFWLNNLLTYRDMRLRGWRVLRGWATFVIACSIGAVANVGVAAYLFERETFWIWSAIAGIIVGSVWNYAVTAVYTWSKPKQA